MYLRKKKAGRRAHLFVKSGWLNLETYQTRRKIVKPAAPRPKTDLILSWAGQQTEKDEPENS